MLHLRLCYIGSLLVVLALLGIGNSATAQSRTLDVQRFRPAFDDAGFIGLDGTRTLPPYRFAFTLFLDFAFDPVEVSVDDDSYAPVEQSLVTHLAAEVGLFGRLNAALYLPMIVHQQGQELPSIDDDLNSFAVADPEIALRYRFLGVDMSERDAPLDGPGLALQLTASVPVGTEDAFAGEGAAQTEAALLADFQLLGAGAGASLGWRHHFRDAGSGGLPKHDEFTFAIGLKLPLPPLPSLIPVLEFRGATAFEENTTALELALGANWKLLSDVVLALAGSVGLSDGYGTPDGRVVLGVRWSPSDSDKDTDGLSDGDDQCPYLAEDLDGFNDGDGCPDPDNDNDLVPDVDDRCPSEQAEEGRDEDEDGCTDPIK